MYVVKLLKSSIYNYDALLKGLKELVDPFAVVSFAGHAVSQ